ncbi:hypothetical protein GCM10011344_33850 [Dokdonia pacifica]|uniref:Natural product n=1 Tax=Dokdonia pacifica TaxID=1627892 RepID=A0A239BEL2_9FLAO|nr:hypothetical protein [Dokdonia pacifica]GGG30149.1 hypothetical protein GCM10011344_33850 [Dokdonia pacifica]SNS05483.1 hypothetical protein SAMN06265376_10669 [Dokdonia pacifica]
MKKLSLISGAVTLNSKQQKDVLGGAGGGPDGEAMVCGCDCAGNVTGPSYCSFIISCPQIYTC